MVRENKTISKEQAVFKDITIQNITPFNFETWPNKFNFPTLNHLYCPEVILVIDNIPKTYKLHILYELGEGMLELKAIKMYLANLKKKNYSLKDTNIGFNDLLKDILQMIQQDIITLVGPNKLLLALTYDLFIVCHTTYNLDTPTDNISSLMYFYIGEVLKAGDFSLQISNNEHTRTLQDLVSFDDESFDSLEKRWISDEFLIPIEVEMYHQDKQVFLDEVLSGTGEIYAICSGKEKHIKWYFINMRDCIHWLELDVPVIYDYNVIVTNPQVSMNDIVNIVREVDSEVTTSVTRTDLLMDKLLELYSKKLKTNEITISASFNIRGNIKKIKSIVKEFPLVKNVSQFLAPTTATFTSYTK